MATFAVMSGNSVMNVIICDNKQIAEEVTNAICIEFNSTNPASIGWQHDGENFIAPKIPTE